MPERIKVNNYTLYGVLNSRYHISNNFVPINTFSILKQYSTFIGWRHYGPIEIRNYLSKYNKLW